MCASREVERCLNDLLIDTVSVPFDFPTLWGEVTVKCINILQWETVFRGEDGGQAMCNTVMDAYVLVYHLISHPCSNTPLVKVNGKEIWEGQQIMAVYSLQSGIFEQHLLNSVISSFGGGDDGSTVQTYVRFWRSFLVAVVNIKTVFSSLADKWSLLGLEDNPLDRTEDIALRKWSSVVLTPHVVAELRKELRALLVEERSGREAPNVSFAVEIKDELSMLPDASYYRSVVEVDYIRDMCDHCSAQVRGTAEANLFEYSKLCLSLIEQEVIRAERFLTNGDHAVDRLVETLVDDRIDVFEYGVVSEWLDAVGQQGADEKLRAVFQLMWWSKCKGAPLIEDMFKDSVSRNTASQLVHAVREAADGNDTFGAIIERFSSIVRKYRDVVKNVFANNGCMLEAMDDGLRSGFVGTRVVNFKKLADRLATLSNSILGKARTTKLQMEDVISVYYFLPDADNAAKDAFLVAYQMHLAKRLLLHHFDEATEQRAMEQLVQIKQSPILFCCRSMLKAARTHSVYLGATVVDGVDVNPALLSRGTWPSLQHAPAAPVVPPAVSRQIAQAQAACSKMRHGQKIDFSASYSSAVVRMALPAGGEGSKKSVQLKVNFLQLCILENFNTKTEWNLRELCEALKVSEGECMSGLSSLAEATVLQLSGAPEPTCVVSLGACDGIADDVVDLMPVEFHSLASSAAAKPREQRSQQSTAKVNPQKLESQLVHLMKQNQSLSVEEIFTQMSNVMTPLTVTRGDFKRVLEKLIERGFITRDASSRRFVYCV